MTPKKYPQNFHSPKNIYFSENPKKISKFKILNPKKLTESTYVWKYQSNPPWGPSAFKIACRIILFPYTQSF